MKEKITKLMKSEGLTTSRLAELLEIQPSAVSHLVSGRNNPRYDLIIRILRRFPRINPDWLLLDSEEMYRDLEGSEEQSMPIEMTLFDDDELLVENNAPTEGLKRTQKTALKDLSIPNGSQTPPLQSGDSATAAQPIRLMVLYDDGSFESFSLKESR